MADSYFDNGRRFYSEVRVNDKVVAGETFIGVSQDDDLKFKLWYSGDRKVVGLAEGDNQNIILAMYDFAAGEAWPGTKADDEPSDTLNRGKRLINAIQPESPDVNLILSHQVAGNVERKIY